MRKDVTCNVSSNFGYAVLTLGEHLSLFEKCLLNYIHVCIYASIYQGRALNFLTGEAQQILIENNYYTSLLRAKFVLSK